MNHTVSIEVGEKLQAAGWWKQTLFSWCPPCAYQRWANKGIHLVYKCGLRREKCDLWTPAPLLSEVLEELPYDDCEDYALPKSFGYATFSGWLFDWMRDPDKAAEVWLEVLGRRNQEVTE